MRLIRSIYLLECCRCEAQTEIMVDTDGFLEPKKIEEKAKEKGWKASILRKGKDLCPKHPR